MDSIERTIQILDLKQYAQPDFVVAFNLDDEDSRFAMKIRVPSNDYLEKLRRECSAGREDIDGTQFYEALAKFMVIGWGGLTPAELERSDVMIFAEGARARLEETLGGAERTIPYTERQLISFVRDSRKVRNTLDKWSRDLGLVKRAMEVARVRNLSIG